MEASSVTNHSMVPQLLEDGNYKTWSSLMEDYLVGQDLWDVVTQPKPDENIPIATSKSKSWKNIIKRWRKNNALALHAIKMSCGPKFLPLVLELKSSQDAWDLLASAANSQPENEEDEGSQEEDVSEDIVEDVIEDIVEDETDYFPFIKAIVEDDLRAMETFIDHHPEALTTIVFLGGKTTLHYAVSYAKKEMAMWLVERMTADDLEILDEYGCTALALGAGKDYPGVLELLQLMVKKNPRLPNIGGFFVPINRVSVTSSDSENLFHFLYSVTDKSVLSPECDMKLGISLFSQFIDMKLYDLAVDLVRLFPDILLHPNVGITPIQKLADTFRDFSREEEDQHPLHDKIYENSNERKQIPNHYDDFVNAVCTAVSTYDTEKLSKSVYPAIINAAKHGNVTFINEMIRANPESLHARDYHGKSMFWHAIENRQGKVFSFIYSHVLPFKKQWLLLDYDEDTGNTIFHLAAMLPPPHVLDSISSSPVLQLQREVFWFKEVWSLAYPLQKKLPNKDGLTPRQLFSRSHAGMIAAGEKLIEGTATSSTVVGALILTIMFAAAFTVPGGNDQAKGYPIFANKILFKLFIICDVLSLSSSATSILVFLTFLTNHHVEEDFLFDLPRRLMMGVVTLFFSIATMMMTFCFALALMLNGRLQLILPLAFVASIPVFLFSKSIFPLVSSIFHSTFGSSIFHRNTKRLTPWDRIALVIASIRIKAALKAMNCGMRAKPKEMDSMV